MRRLVIALFALVIPLTLTAQSDTLAVRIFPLNSVDHIATMSPDGRLLAISENGIVHNDVVIPEYLPIRVFDLDNGTEIFTLEGHTDYATSLAFNDDGSRLATYHRVGWIYVWDMSNGELIRQIPALPNAQSIVFVPGTNLLVQADDSSMRGTLMVWDTETGYIVNNLISRFENVNEERLYLENLPFAVPNIPLNIFPLSDGETIYTPTLLDSIVRWNLTTGEATDLVPLPEEAQTFLFWDMAFTEDEQTAFYTNAREETITQIDLQTGEILTVYDFAEMDLAGRGTLDIQAETAVFLTKPDDDIILHITPVDDLYDGTTHNLTTSLLPIITEAPRHSPLISAQLSEDGKRLVIVGFIGIDDPSENFFVVIER